MIDQVTCNTLSTLKLSMPEQGGHMRHGPANLKKYFEYFKYK